MEGGAQAVGVGVPFFSPPKRSLDFWNAIPWSMSKLTMAFGLSGQERLCGLLLLSS